MEFGSIWHWQNSIAYYCNQAPTLVDLSDIMVGRLTWYIEMRRSCWAIWGPGCHPATMRMKARSVLSYPDAHRIWWDYTPHPPGLNIFSSSWIANILRTFFDIYIIKDTLRWTYPTSRPMSVSNFSTGLRLHHLQELSPISTTLTGTTAALISP